MYIIYIIYYDVMLDSPFVASMLSMYFASVFSAEYTNNLPLIDTSTYHDINVLSHIELSSCTFYKKLEKLKPEKSPGVRNIYPVVLCNLASVLTIPLCSIYQQIIECNVILEDWQLADVTPLFKKGSRGQFNSYRSISLTSVCCEVLESILIDNIMEHLECTKLINDSQHGLRSGRSCVTYLLTFLEDSTKFIDEGGCVDVIYLDFCKAFDKVLHQRLLLRLQMHGMGIKICNWIGNWLHNCTQRVVVNGVKSEWLPVMSAV